jgi:hypothetical protein
MFATLRIRMYILLALSVVGVLPLAARCTPVNAGQTEGKPSVVKLIKTNDGYQLLRNGQPFFIKGAGGDGSMSLLAAAGANSLRTWGADNLGPLLDEAQKQGLTITIGIWLGHVDNFNYDDADQVAAQYERARQAILKYKDHPALLMWAIGNEMEGYGKGDHGAVWSAINNIASMAHKLDPNHPTMTVMAEIGGDKVKNVHRLCPDIDIVGINSYGGVASLPQRYKQAGGEKPFIVTEFGPPGVWEMNKNEWGVAIEPTSTEKAAIYHKDYTEGILAAKGQCLGSYAFTWGSKAEATATWFGLLLPDNSRLAAVDTLTELWSGKPPANRCPEIAGLKVEGPTKVEPGATVRATLETSAPQGNPLKVTWVLQADPLKYGNAGESDAALQTYEDAIVSSSLKQAQVRMPKDGGPYRLYAYVHDNKGGAAVANVPLYVNAPITIPSGKVVKVPFAVYEEGGVAMAYAPTGWMGNTKAMKLDLQCMTTPHAGKTCARMDYTEKDGWGGIVWQSPENNWGNKPGGYNVTGAKKLTFWARGEKGDEIVKFGVGLVSHDKPFYDTAQSALDNVRLTPQWKQYTIDLTGKDLTRIVSGFYCTIAGHGTPITFYFDDIRFE